MQTFVSSRLIKQRLELGAPLLIALIGPIGKIRSGTHQRDESCPAVVVSHQYDTVPVTHREDVISLEPELGGQTNRLTSAIHEE